MKQDMSRGLKHMMSAIVLPQPVSEVRHVQH